jgi:hypothetical protein
VRDWPLPVCCLSQTRRQLPDDWTDRLHYEHWPDLIAWLPPDWPDLLRTLPPDWGVIQKSLPGDWAEAVRELKPDWRNRLPAGWVWVRGNGESRTPVDEERRAIAGLMVACGTMNRAAGSILCSSALQQPTATNQRQT